MSCHASAPSAFEPFKDVGHDGDGLDIVDGGRRAIEADIAGNGGLSRRMPFLPGRITPLSDRANRWKPSIHDPYHYRGQARELGGLMAEASAAASQKAERPRS